MFNKSQQQLLEKFSSQSDKLFSLGIIRTDSYTGEIGEYVVSAQFDLIRTDKVTPAIDAIDNAGQKYQIKAKFVYNRNFNYSIRNVDLSKINFLVVIYFDIRYNPIRIIRIKEDQLPQAKIGISKKFLNSIEYDEFFNEDLNIPKTELKEILVFGKIYKSLLDQNIIRSRRIVGDIGEFYACQYLKLKLNDNPNEKGVDAVGNDGIKYEVKTRRVYDSGRRKSKTRRLNNLVGKSADYLVVVVLNKCFKCAGMWTIPIKNIKNLKSAHLQIVNTTTGVKNIVKSKIDWLN